MADEIRVNGNAHSWGSIIVKIGGDRYYGFTSIEYGDKRTRVKGYGMGKHHAPRARSRGKYEIDPVKMSGHKGSMQELRNALAQAGNGVSYGDTEFDIVVQFIEKDDKPVTIEIERCVFTDDKSSHEEGSDPLTDDAEFDAMLIRRNGLTLFDNSEAAL